MGSELTPSGIITAAMSALGQTRRFRDVRDMSGLPQTTDLAGPARHFAFVPILLQKSVEVFVER
jgi:hypothetical protein